MMFSPRTIVRSMLWIALAMLIIVVFHLGQGVFALRVGQFAPLSGAFLGGCLALISATTLRRRNEPTEPWIGNEQFGWVLIGLGAMLWGTGDCFWRYYVSIGQNPFPSLADIGYSSFPLLVFGGLLLQPSSGAGRKRTLLLLDSLIAMGSILAIAWYLLLGSLAQAPGEANFAKLLGIYYPIADTALLSCVMFLLLRGQGRAYQATARRTSLLVLGLGLCFFVFSDFLFNVQNNAGTYVEATWIDLGWPFGMMTMGVAAYLRRFLPATAPDVIEQRVRKQSAQIDFGLTQLVPYPLLAVLLFVLSLNIFAADGTQVAIRPILLLATLGVVALVVVRQIVTLRDNARLVHRQAETLEGLESANKRIAQQSQAIAQHNLELEHGIDHLKTVQARLANGDLNARARLSSGALLPLAGSFNLMAERLMKFGQTLYYAQRVAKALDEVSRALECTPSGETVLIPQSCGDVAEVNRLVMALRQKKIAALVSVPRQSASSPPPVSRQGTQEAPAGQTLYRPTSFPATGPRTNALGLRPSPPLQPMSPEAESR